MTHDSRPRAPTSPFDIHYPDKEQVARDCQLSGIDPGMALIKGDRRR